MHQSLHPSLRTALAVLPGLRFADGVEPAVWTAALRAVGEGHTRRLRTGVWGEWPEDLDPSADLSASAQPVRKGPRRFSDVIRPRPNRLRGIGCPCSYSALRFGVTW
ncbi:hypothetical protein Ntsu_80880 [Nocardia sp. IFM 10818]